MNPTLRIDRVSLAGVPDALPLLLAQFAEHGISRTVAETESALGGLVTADSRGAVLLARDPRPVGIAVMAYTWTVEHGGLVAWLDELYVVPDRRGQGIGTALLGAVTKLVRAEGCLALELEVEADHLRAAGLYVRAGFRRLSRTRYSTALSPLA